MNRALLCAFLALTACKSRNLSQISETANNPQIQPLVQEPFIANRLPISILKEDAAGPLKNAPLPLIETIQNQNGTEYGIRRIPHPNDAMYAAVMAYYKRMDDQYQAWQAKSGSEKQQPPAYEDPPAGDQLAKLIKPMELEKWIRPGDIAVQYNVLAKPMSGVSLLKMGMPHAAIVVRNFQPGTGFYTFPQQKIPNNPEAAAKQLCHIDMPDVAANCDWDGSDSNSITSSTIIGTNWHFFRVAEANMGIDNIAGTYAEKSEQMAINLYMRGKLGRERYNSAFKTEILSDCQGVCNMVNKGECPKFYCSEFPFTMHSVARGEVLFDGMTLSHLLADLKVIQASKFFPSLDSVDEIKKSIIKYVQESGNVDAEATAMIDNVVNLYFRQTSPGTPSLAQSLQSSADLLQKKIVEASVGKEVPPHAFMYQAKRTAPRKVYYIGSLESPYYHSEEEVPPPQATTPNAAGEATPTGNANPNMP